MSSTRANSGFSSSKKSAYMSNLPISTIRRHVLGVVIPSLQYLFISWSRWSSKSVWYHHFVWHPIEPCHVVVFISSMYRTWHHVTLLGYQMTLEILKYHIKISMMDCGRSGLKGTSRNNLHIAKLAHHLFRKVRIHKSRPTC